MSSLVSKPTITGLDIQAAMRRAKQTSSESLPEAAESAADLVAGKARDLIPRGRTGNARASLKAMGATVSLGGPDAPYAPWLDFGGRVGIKKSVDRRYIRGGRYLWPVLHDQTKSIDDLMADNIARAVERAGVEVT